MSLRNFLNYFNGKILALIFIMDFLKIVYWPDLSLLFWAFVLVVLDLITGIVKAHAKGEFVISNGIKKTILKLAQYAGAITVCFILSNVVALNKVGTSESVSFWGDGAYEKIKLVCKFLNNLVILMIVYVESLSNLENCLEINKTSTFSKFVMSPLHKVLSLAILSNVIKTISDATPKG